jgi:hypothetical protein
VPAVEALVARPAYRRDDELARLEAFDILPDVLDDAEILVAQNQELFAARGLAVQASLISASVAQSPARTIRTATSFGPSGGSGMSRR